MYVYRIGPRLMLSSYHVNWDGKAVTDLYTSDAPMLVNGPINTVTYPAYLEARLASASTGNELRWSESSSVETGFSILRSSSEYGDYDVVGWVGPKTTSYLDATAPTNEVNWYKVREEGPGGPLYSDPVSIARPPVSVTALMSALSESPGDFGAFRFTRDDWYPNYETAVRFTLGGEAAAGVDYELIGPDGQAIEDGVVTIPAKRDSVDVIVRAIADNVSELDERIVLTLTAGAADGYRLGFWAEATLTIDETPDLIDIDSDNTNGFDDPDRTPEEDRIEDDITKPGKILAVNDNDDDGDGIPDFADGFDWDGITSDDDRAAFDDPNTPEHEPEEQFVPVILVLPEGVNPSVAKVKLTYSASDPKPYHVTENPDGLQRTGSGTAQDPYIYAAGPGDLRLWTKDGSAARDKASLATGGDFVPSDVELSWSALPDGPTADTRRLWLEAIAPSTNLGDQQITVSLDPDGPGPGGYVESDAVRVTTPNWQVLQGDVDPATGRGAVGSGSTILHPLDGAAIPSNPVPHITVTSFDVGNVRNDGGDQLVADLRVEGAITFALADIAPEDGADLSTAVVRVGVNSYTIPLRRVDETPTLLRPYARGFEFAQTLRGVPVAPGGNAVRVESIDAVLGNLGWAETTFAVDATNAPDEENPPAQPPTRDFFDTFLQSMKLRVDFADFTSLAEAAAAGPGAVRVDARNAPMDDPEPATSWAQLDLPPDEPPVIWAPDGTLLVLEDVSDLNLSSTELEHFTAYAIHPDKGIGLVLLHFEETAVDTNEFVSQYVEVSILLESIPDPGQPDTIQAGVRKTLWDSQGTWHTAVLTEDGPDSMRFTGSGLSVDIEALSGLGAAYRDLLTVTVTSTGQNINALKVGAKETTAQSQVFETSSEFKASASVWRNIWTEAWLGGPWSATPSGSWDYSSPGYYAPLVMELMAPAGLGPQLAVAFFDDADHPLMAIEGRQIAASRGFPDVFAMVPQLLGGLHTALMGQVAATSDPVKPKWVNRFDGGRGTALQVRVVNAAIRVFDMLIEVAQARHTARFGADPGSSCFPGTSGGPSAP